ncbi:Transcription initiation factor TFIID subunit 9 [Rhizina undulata]
MSEPNGFTEHDASKATAVPVTDSNPAAAGPVTDKDVADPNAGNRKPRDARIIHLILASMGVSSYQERVPLMLMDFAYRYTTSVLQDALLYSDAINGTANTGGQNPPASINIDDLRMSIASRINHQFNTALPKEFLMEIAQERNKVALPTVGKEFGIRLPSEKYCLTGINWDLADGGDDGMDDSEDEGEQAGGDNPVGDGMELDELFSGEGDSSMQDV